MSVASITYAQKPAVPVGTTLLAAFAVFLTGFWGFTVLTIIPVLAQIGIEAAVTAMGLGKGALIGPQMAVTTIADCGCLFAADRLMNGQAFPTAEMGQATRRWLPLVGVVLLTTLGTALAGLLLVVPGLMLGCALSVAMPACIVEDLGVFASLKRSRELTAGHRWPIFWALAAMVLVTFGAIFLANMAIIAVSPATGPLSDLFLNAFDTVAMPVAMTLFVLLSSVLHHTLRALKEDNLPQRMTSVFR